jgi:hypothetical protein
MVAYSFKDRFCQPIVDGTKGGTIRADRRRHARPGEEVQCYYGMRTKHCRLVARKTCVAVYPITLFFSHHRDSIEMLCAPDLGWIWSERKRLDAFARFDGFQDWADMRAFWEAEHDNFARFDGVHIRWAPLPAELLA